MVLNSGEKTVEVACFHSALVEMALHGGQESVTSLINLVYVTSASWS